MASAIFNTLIEQTRAQEDQYDKYRDEFEDTKHWYARKEFIRHNWDRYKQFSKTCLVILSLFDDFSNKNCFFILASQISRRKNLKNDRTESIV